MTNEDRDYCDVTDAEAIAELKAHGVHAEELHLPFSSILIADGEEIAVRDSDGFYRAEDILDWLLNVDKLNIA